MKKIIIALDFDPSVEKVAMEGHSLARSMNAHVTLVHVMADSSYYMPLDYSPVMGYTGIPPVDVMEPGALDKLREAARDFLEHVKETLRDPDIQVRVLEGDPAHSILQFARQEHAAMIVLGTHGRNALEEMIMGSVTKKLIRDSEFPLYVIPTKKQKSG